MTRSFVLLLATLTSASALAADPGATLILEGRWDDVDPVHVVVRDWVEAELTAGYEPRLTVELVPADEALAAWVRPCPAHATVTFATGRRFEGAACEVAFTAEGGAVLRIASDTHEGSLRAWVVDVQSPVPSRSYMALDLANVQVTSY